MSYTVGPHSKDHYLKYLEDINTRVEGICHMGIFEMADAPGICWRTMYEDQIEIDVAVESYLIASNLDDLIPLLYKDIQ